MLFHHIASRETPFRLLFCSAPILHYLLNPPGCAARPHQQGDGCALGSPAEDALRGEGEPAACSATKTEEHRHPLGFAGCVLPREVVLVTEHREQHSAGLVTLYPAGV